MGIRQFLHLFIGRLQHWGNEKLRHTLPMLDGLRFFAVVQQNHPDLTTIVTVDNAHLIGRGKTPLDTHGASGINETGASGSDDGTLKKEPVRVGKKIGRNDPCPCGSGLKYKKCCGKDQ